MKYLTEEHLKGFDKYKYNSIDTSILSVHVMHPFWNWLVKFFPRWMAPNVMTFAGFMLTVLNFFLIAHYDYHFTAADQAINPIPNWLWLLAAVNLWVAYTLDGLDGKQARRTGTSGPLGELFDHGLDSYSSIFIPIYIFSLFGITDLTPYHMHFVVMNVFLNFHLTHFEKYNTGVMFLPWAYDFVMWGVSIALGVTCIFGPQIYRTVILGYPMARYVEFSLYISAVLTSHPVILKNIYYSYKNKTGKMRPFCDAIRPLIPLFGLFAVSSVWVFLSQNSIVHIEPRVLFMCFGTIFSNFTCRLIVAQMSGTKADAWNSLLTVLGLVTCVCIFPYKALGYDFFTSHVEQWILYGLTAVCTVCHVHYGAMVVIEMCNHFKIRCFKVRDSHETMHEEVEKLIKEN